LKFYKLINAVVFYKQNNSYILYFMYLPPESQDVLTDFTSYGSLKKLATAALVILLIFILQWIEFI